MFSHADGFQVTPLQLGTLVSAMANGGRLLTPQIPHSSKEANKMSPKVRRVLPISADVWQRMVPGMVGAVNYGTGQRAYDPTQTVAGKTGTCIGDNGWVGLFASYAPLANPRLAVVVIAEGTDGRRHFPVSVAGEIYRQLNHRFGTAINLQVASTLDDEEKEVADQEAAAENTANGDGEESTATATSGSTTQGDAAAPAPAGTTTAKPTTPEPKNTVKRVLMPLNNKTTETPKSTAQPNNSKTAVPPANTDASGAQRPRRIQP
jgi:membrane peptidoglycan carboxypeptidase